MTRPSYGVSPEEAAPVSRHILLTPGPVQTSAFVRQAILEDGFGHRDPAFSVLLSRLEASLKRIADAPDHDAVLLTGSATAAVEGAFSTFLPADQGIVVVSNGAFGERLAEVARVLGLKLKHLRYDWGKPIPLNEVKAALASDPSFRAVAMVQHETSTGCLTPIREIGAIAAWHKAQFFVDAVSSLGAEPFSAAQIGAAVVIGSANKCLHAIPGVSFLLVRKDLWAGAEDRPGRSFYLDLRRYRAASCTLSQTPFTPALHPMLALDAAIAEFEHGGGQPARHARYVALNTRLRNGFANMGVKVRHDASQAGVSVILAEQPRHLSFAEFYDALRLRGFIIYESKGLLRDNWFIVSNMGALDEAVIDGFLAAFAEIRAPRTVTAAVS